MTNTNPTTTAQATVLSEDRVRKMLGATGFIDPPDAAKDMRDLCRAYLALTEQVRVLRSVVEWYADEDNQDSFGCFWDDLTRDNGDRARRALAALEGSGE